MSFFGGLADEARRGEVTRRRFLAVALALGIGGEREVDDALNVRVYAVPPRRVECFELVEAYDELLAADALFRQGLQEIRPMQEALKKLYPDVLNCVWYPKRNDGLLFALPERVNFR